MKSFMRGLAFVSALKLRASMGTTGNSAINPYQTEGSLNRTAYNFGGTTAAGYVPGSIPNPGLKWERTAQTDVGVDFGFFSNRITGTLDLYRERTSDLLLPRSLPASTGFSTVLQNVGTTGNAGWELSISTVNLPGTHGGLRWTTDLSFTHNENYIISLATATGDDVGNRWFLGQPINVGGGAAQRRRERAATRSTTCSTTSGTSASGSWPTPPSRVSTGRSPVTSGWRT